MCQSCGFRSFETAQHGRDPKFADLYGFKRTNTLSRDKLNYEAGTIRNIHYGDIHTKFKPLCRVCEERVPYVNPSASANEIDDDTFCEEGDIVLADASEDLNDVGKAIEVVSLDGEQVVAGTHTILATRRESVPVVGFGGQLFQSTAVRTGIKREAQGAKVYGISANRISDITVPVPPTEAEQQKIADCLGSLDDLIAAEARKLEALRQHKQGLMQQLFPQPGESVPILRFPDSDDGSEWQYKVFPEIATNLNNMRIPVTEQDRIPGKVPYYGASGVVDYVKDHIFDEDLLCVSEDGANLAARTYPIAFSISGRTWVNNHTHVLRFEKSVTQILVQAYLNHIDISDYLTGMAQPKLNRAMLDSIPIALPPTPHEENDVASCIASFDHLLSMRYKKLESLSTHKQGLLQQLFPSPEGESR